MLLISSAHADDIHGAGATFPAPAYLKWAEGYAMRKVANVEYVGVGSGEGIKRIDARAVDFGASDMPLKLEELDKKGLLQFPMLMGAITPVVNLPGIFVGQLKLDGPTLAAIYMGKVRKWNDPQLRKLNPDLQLPDFPISVIYREDKSGTTFNFTNYLSKVSPEWQAALGEGLSVSWPVGQSAKGNGGVSEKVNEIKGAIGYVEYAYAMEHQLDYVQLKNHDGRFVKPNSETTEAAAAGAKWDASNGFYQILTNAPGPRSWPIAATTFILVPRESADAAHAREVLKFFDWAYRTGELPAMYLDYVMIPHTLMNMVRSSWQGLKSRDGKQVWN
ncbi:MAG TPA: phosphate ABC transporter substrate-binding protein PstS [Gallionellaceae bacterium]|nr:phosphate ABC transporter substrate-binding protein PstS [Gallionellaceae bacterium]